jgi:hypothetical protein
MRLVPQVAVEHRMEVSDEQLLFAEDYLGDSA